MFVKGERVHLAGKPWRPSNHTELMMFIDGPCKSCVHNRGPFDMCEPLSVVTSTSETDFYYDDDGQPQCPERDVE